MKKYLSIVLFQKPILPVQTEAILPFCSVSVLSPEQQNLLIFLFYVLSDVTDAE